eukprot:NODE_776_length_4349_cov_0.124471.p1 type:complete len:388 gc:universal NODE_776_length_4349_cov_0.124471:410-1573(+)
MFYSIKVDTSIFYSACPNCLHMGYYRLSTVILVGVIAILAVYLKDSVKILGLFRETFENGDCKAIYNGFCEKIVLFDDKIYSFCSTFKKRSEYYPTLHLNVTDFPAIQQDELVVYDGSISKIPIKFDNGLLVNGFDIKSSKGKTILVATNAFNMTIEEFQLGEKLVHKKTINSDLFHALDDVTISDFNEYVITNDHSEHAASNLLYRSFEDIFSLPNGNVLIYKSNNVEVIIPHLPNANGLLIKYEQGNQLWVTSPTEGAIFRYNFNPAHEDYTFIDKITLDFPPDNISQVDGTVYVAGMLKGFNLLNAILKWRNADENGYFGVDLQSQIVEIKNETSHDKFFGNLYSRDSKIQSKKLHFSTGAIKFNDGYIVSGFNSLMYCKESNK